jgi:mannose-6-phosphate isomerase-like protein (cupin superfamily)
MKTETLFNELPWEQVNDLVRQKKSEVDEKTVRLLELQDGFTEPQWCYKGHVGYVVKGSIQVEFESETQTFNSGDVVVLPSAVAHKAKSCGKTILFLVDG